MLYGLHQTERLVFKMKSVFIKSWRQRLVLCRREWSAGVHVLGRCWIFFLLIVYLISKTCVCALPVGNTLTLLFAGGLDHHCLFWSQTAMEVVDDLRNESEGNFILLCLCLHHHHNHQRTAGLYWFPCLACCCACLWLNVTGAGLLKQSKMSVLQSQALKSKVILPHCYANILPSSIKKEKLFQFSFHFSSFLTV